MLVQLGGVLHLPSPGPSLDALGMLRRYARANQDAIKISGRCGRAWVEVAVAVAPARSGGIVGSCLNMAQIQLN